MVMVIDATLIYINRYFKITHKFNRL